MVRCSSCYQSVVVALVVVAASLTVLSSVDAFSSSTARRTFVSSRTASSPIIATNTKVRVGSVPFTATNLRKTSSSSSSSLQALLDPSSLANSELLAYSDDPLGDLLFGANGFVIAGIVATIAAVGVLFTVLIPKIGAGSATFTLSEEEELAVQRVSIGYDSKDWEQELTEEGTKGYVNRKRQAEEAKVAYKKNAGGLTSSGDGEVETFDIRRAAIKDRSLRYAETNLGFIACLLRAADPTPGMLLVNLGSGTGRSTLAAATLFPKFKKCVGVEFLAPLIKLSNSYKGKVKGSKAAVEFTQADMADYDLSKADLVFASAKYLTNGDLEKSLESLSSGAKVMITDKRLGGGFKLVTQVDDPSGDLVLNTGYVYEKV